jgi:chromosome segregation ATPase
VLLKSAWRDRIAQENWRVPMRLLQSAAAVPALLLLAACATSPDPTQGGFISGVNDLMSGGYNQRVATQSMELDRMRAQQAAAEANAYQANAALAERQRSLANLRSDVARLDRSLKDVQARAAQQRAQNVALSDRDRQLMRDLDTAKARMASLQEQLRSRPAGDDYDAVQQEYLSLQKAIAALNEQLRGDRL